LKKQKQKEMPLSNVPPLTVKCATVHRATWSCWQWPNLRLEHPLAHHEHALSLPVASGTEIKTKAFRIMLNKLFGSGWKK
jgi:hypothetical protein